MRLYHRRQVTPSPTLRTANWRRRGSELYVGVHWRLCSWRMGGCPLSYCRANRLICPTVRQRAGPSPALSVAQPFPECANALDSPRAAGMCRLRPATLPVSYYEVYHGYDAESIRRPTHFVTEKPVVSVVILRPESSLGAKQDGSRRIGFSNVACASYETDGTPPCVC